MPHSFPTWSIALTAGLLGLALSLALPPVAHHHATTARLQPALAPTAIAPAIPPRPATSQGSPRTLSSTRNPRPPSLLPSTPQASAEAGFPTLAQGLWGGVVGGLLGLAAARLAPRPRELHTTLSEQTPWTSASLAGSKPSSTIHHSSSRVNGRGIRTALQAEDTDLTVGSGADVPEFMKGKSLNVVLDLGKVRDRLSGVGVVLLGMAGCQKTATAENLATALKYAAMDTVAVLEEATGESMADLLRENGGEEVRAEEKHTLSEIVAYRQVVLTTSPDLVMDKPSWGHFRHCITVYLEAPAKTLAAQLEEEGPDAVSLFEQEAGVAALEGSLEERVQAVLDQRASTYAQADITVDAAGRPDTIAMRVAQALEQLLEANQDHVKHLQVPDEVEIVDE